MTPSSFDLARLAALKAYARLEFETCLLLRNILDVDQEVASAIFYQVTNTRARYAIIGNLMEIKQAGKWKAWPRIAAWLGPRDTARNHLIHWFEDKMYRVELTGGLGSDVKSFEEVPRLKNATRLGRSQSPSETFYSEQDIHDERDAIIVMKHIVNRLELTVGDPDTWPWRDIFQQPISDRSAVEFLQRLNDAGHPARLPPYRE